MFMYRSIKSIVLFAFFLRIALPLAAILLHNDKSIFYSPDTLTYLKPAEEIINTGHFSTDGSPEIVRTPGYPLFLILGLLTKNSEITIIFLQIIISCTTVYLIYRISLLLFEKERIALFSAALYAIEPLSILYASKILTETLFTFFIVLFLYFYLKYNKNPHFIRIILSALFLAISVYIRPVSFYIPPYLFVAIGLWSLFNRESSKKLVIHSLFLCLISLGLVGIWIVRNNSAADYSGISSISDINLYFYQGASVIATEKKIDFYELQDQMGFGNSSVYYQNHPEQQNWSAGERFRYMRQEGLKAIFQNPITYTKIHLKGIFRILFDPGATDYLKILKKYQKSGGLLGRIVDKGLINTILLLFTENPLLIWSNVFLVFFLVFYYCLAIIPVIFGKIKLGHLSFFLITLISLYFIIISGGAVSLSRFRHPVMPMICIFGGAGWYWVISWLKDRNLELSSTVRRA